MKNVSKLRKRKEKNQHTHQSDLEIGKRHPSVVKITKTVNATKKQQPWQLSFTDKLDLRKIKNDFISKTDECYNQFGHFTEANFI